MEHVVGTANRMVRFDSSYQPLQRRRLWTDTRYWRYSVVRQPNTEWPLKWLVYKDILPGRPQSSGSTTLNGPSLGPERQPNARYGDATIYIIRIGSGLYSTRQKILQRTRSCQCQEDTATNRSGAKQWP